jgi:hypothetical protein
MVELAMVLGWPLADVVDLDDAALATMVDVLEERAARG